MPLLSALLAPLVLGAVLVVSPGGPYDTIGEALAAARPGDTIEVHGGIHQGPIVVDRSVTLVGVGAPVLDGGGHGTVITLAAPDTTLRGFVVRSSGADFNTEDAGIEVKAPRAVVEGNRLEDVLAGISLDNAPESVIRGNNVRGKDLPQAQRGDGLRLWYSSSVLVEGNTVEDARDCVAWYSSGVRIVGNRVERGRYGLHLMYDDGIELTDNVLRGNSVGAYLMYSRGVSLRGNLLASSRGPSGFGLGLKDVDDLTAEYNWLVDNRVGAWIDNTPRSMDSEGRFHANLFAYNDVGLMLQPAVERDTLWANAFRDNVQQIGVAGGGATRQNNWSKDGVGNYWSDYRGFDASDDGIGDVPYRAEMLFDELMDRHPELRLFQYGLAANAVEFAARAFPALGPVPKLVDPAPLMAPPAIPEPPGIGAGNPWPALATSLGLLALAGGVLGLSVVRRSRPPATTSPSPRQGSRPAEEVSVKMDSSAGARRASQVPNRAQSSEAEPAPLRVTHLVKRFGRTPAVDGLSFGLRAGEGVALWGPNGAGKSTALKCIVGCLSCEGEVEIAGRDALRQGRVARRALGYVPQEVAFHDDLTVAETCDLYARLKRAPRHHAESLLEQLGLAENAAKRVGALSGGLRQRLALALALLGDPPLLLLDEPTSNLDALGREQVLHLMSDLRERGTAILIASHRLEEVEALADRVLVLDHGRIALTCPGTQLARSLGLRLSVELTVASSQREAAVAVLRSGGMLLSPNGAAIKVEVLPGEKMAPIRLLEGAGIPVADFSIGGDRGAGQGDSWTR